MSLANLAKIGSLVAQAVDPAETRRLLQSAERSLADARRDELAPESRFDLAYKAIMHCAIAGLRAKGYRLSTSKPGHHQVAIQALVHTLGCDQGSVNALDVMRRKRNGIDYEADLISESMATGCIDAAAGLVRLLRTQLR